jgi:hypothetical protein
MAVRDRSFRLERRLGGSGVSQVSVRSWTEACYAGMTIGIAGVLRQLRPVSELLGSAPAPLCDAAPGRPVNSGMREFELVDAKRHKQRLVVRGARAAPAGVEHLRLLQAKGGALREEHVIDAVVVRRAGAGVAWIVDGIP